MWNNERCNSHTRTHTHRTQIMFNYFPTKCHYHYKFKPNFILYEIVRALNMSSSFLIV